MELRAGMKRAASEMSRSQFEIYTFATKHSLSVAAADELLMLVGNVRDRDPSHRQIICFDVLLYCTVVTMQDFGFDFHLKGLGLKQSKVWTEQQG
jgi:hypothetical protein